MYKILIVEDDAVIAEGLCCHLQKWDYEVVCVKDFRFVLDLFHDCKPQLVLLDISLPFYNGYHWCTEIRRISNVPILFISSASDNMNIVMAVSMGGDDFLPKPFDLSVATAKIQAILRRTYSLSAQANLVEHKGVILNLKDASLSFQTKRLELTKNEFKIIQLLLENIGSVVNRDAIMTRLWQSDSFIDDNTLTVNVARLRRRLDEIGLECFIKTKKGIGYLVE